MTDPRIDETLFTGLRPRHLRQLKRAALQVQAQDEAEVARQRRLQAAMAKHPCRKHHKAIGDAVGRGDMRNARRLLEKAPAVYQAVFWLCRWGARVAGT